MKSLIKTAVFIFSLGLVFPAGAKEAVLNPININTASSEQLMVLPGVGPKIAQAIIEGRMQKPYQSKEELLQVKGVGEKRIAQWEGRITYGLLELPLAAQGTKELSSNAPLKPAAVPIHP